VLLTAVQRQRLSYLFVAGVGLTAAGLYFDPLRTLAHVLIASYIWLALALAGAVFLALHYVTKAGWSVAIKRVPESMAATLPYAALTFLVVLILVHAPLYGWAGHTTAEGEPALTPGKVFWLSPLFFLLRAAFLLTIWVVLSRRLITLSHRQDQDGDARLNLAGLRAGAQFLVVFALTFSLASFDWFMSLEPHWASTIYGVYGFGGLFCMGLSTITLLTIWLKRRGSFGHAVTENHLHDLGKLLLAFCTFWAYIWLCQYLLIWYANIPEETVYYKDRHTGAYAVAEGVNLALNWALPFFLLLPRGTKRNERALRAVAGLVLVGGWVDLFTRVLPAVSPNSALLVPLHLGPLALVVPIMLFSVSATLHRAPLIARGDPLLIESLHLHQ
jgi:hypothetical protein